MSGTSSQPSRDHFLIDRSTSPQFVRPLGRLYQLRGVTLADVFGEDHSQKMPDTEWIEYCGRNGVVALTANVDIWKVPEERDCILEFRTRIIAWKPTMTLLEGAMVIGQNSGLIRKTVRSAGPLFIQIGAGSPTRRKLE